MNTAKIKVNVVADNMTVHGFDLTGLLRKALKDSNSDLNFKSAFITAQVGNAAPMKLKIDSGVEKR